MMCCYYSLFSMVLLTLKLHLNTHRGNLGLYRNNEQKINQRLKGNAIIE